MDTTASSAYVWALHEMGFADFNDERLNKRIVKIASTLLQHPQNSIPQACKTWSDTKAVYRFFANNKVNSQNMLSSHIVETVNRCSSFPTVLVAQDTTTINVGDKQISGLGRIDDKNSQGLFIHSGLAMSPTGVPLGIAYQKTYVRKEETQRKGYREKYQLLPIEQKESIRWVETLESVTKTFSGKHIVLIGDRESDIYDVFQKAQGKVIDLLVRTAWNRKILNSEQQETDNYLFSHAKKGKILVNYKTQIPIKGSHKTRETTLVIRANSFTLVAPQKRTGKHPEIPLYILDVSEENPPEEEPIHWMLTTTMEVATLDQAIEKVQWYMYRWRIERFHYILKTGAFNIEKLQFETFPRFKKAITMYSIVAWRILWTTYNFREHPKDNAESIFSEHEVKTLCLVEKKVTYTMTVQEAVVAMAKLGGFLARKHDGSPGIKSLWIGFQTLQYMMYGILMAEKAHFTLSKQQ